MPSLILKRTSASRSSGEWRDDDYYYDVLEDDVVVGRIFCLDAVGRRAAPGCGRAATMARYAARRTATSGRARRRWRFAKSWRGK
jgi:hypothetical protein